jgi:hypothetical protein
MSDHHGLDARLRAALGEGGPAARAGSGRAGDGQSARSRVLSGIRQRRLRRLQLAGGAAVVVIGLVVGLPQVLGSTPASPNRFATHGKSTTSRSPAASPAPPARTGSAAAPTGAGAQYGTRAAPAQMNGPVCQVRARKVRPCGAVAKGSAGLSLTRAATSLQQAVNSTGVYGTATGPAATWHLVPSLVVHPGTTIVIELPRVSDRWRWTTPAIAGNPTYHGQGPPVVARATKAHGHLQRFVVKANVAVTVVLEAQADRYTGSAPPSIVEPPAVWALELKVEGT